MKTKKIIMITLLLLFIIGLVVIWIGVNNYSNQKNIEKESISDNEAEDNLNNLIEVTDNYFIEQTNDMFYNVDDYIGKTIKIQGFVYSYEGNNNDKYYCVVRNTPGCCGNDGLAGLDIRFDGRYPKESTWVEVIGILEKDNVFDRDIPAIKVNTIREVPEGIKFVTN